MHKTILVEETSFVGCHRLFLEVNINIFLSSLPREIWDSWKEQQRARKFSLQIQVKHGLPMVRFCRISVRLRKFGLNCEEKLAFSLAKGHLKPFCNSGVGGGGGGGGVRAR